MVIYTSSNLVLATTIWGYSVCVFVISGSVMLPLIFINNIKINNMETKQETVEEAAEKYCLINNIPIDQMIVKTDRSCEFETPITMFTHGAKWQQERMEEILRKAYFDRIDDIDVDGYWISDPEKDLEMLIEQFKKQ